VLEFDDNNVDCERKLEFDIGEIDVIIGAVGTVGPFGVEGCGGGRQFTSKQKISTTSEYPFELYPPPNNILFVAG
jgi:hypothetical protein